jgi:hypothetical protein
MKNQKTLSRISDFFTIFLAGYLFGTGLGLLVMVIYNLSKASFIEMINNYEFWKMIFHTSIRLAIILILVIITTTPRNNGNNSISN